MNLRQAIEDFENQLTAAGVSSPRANAEWILCSVLGVERPQLLLQSERVLTSQECETLAGLIRRRVAREPLQYILGKTSFCGCEIATAPGVLVPRPETELLAEEGWQFLQKRSAPRALDYCTGSGCIAISLATYALEAQICAVDISEDALRIARANARELGLEKRISFIQGDSLQAALQASPFDLILSNPPYIPSAEIEGLEPEVSLHEPRLALDGGDDGLKFYHTLAQRAPEFLKEDGLLMAEFGDDQYPAIEEIFHAQGWAAISPRKDYAAKERFFVARFSGPVASSH